MWNSKELSSSLKHQAEQSRKEAERCRDNANDKRLQKNRDQYMEMSDESKAKFDVFDYLEGKDFLHSKSSFLGELQRCRDASNVYHGRVFNEGSYLKHRIACIDDLIRRYSV